MLFSSSAVAGFLASFFSLPFDNAKTKMQKMKKGPDGKFPYANIFDAMMKVNKLIIQKTKWIIF